MSEFKLMVSHNCGISYSEEMSTTDRQDPKLLEKIEEVSKKGFRFYIDGDDDYLCPVHKTILHSFHDTQKQLSKNKTFEEHVKELQARFPWK